MRTFLVIHSMIGLIATATEPMASAMKGETVKESQIADVERMLGLGAIVENTPAPAAPAAPEKKGEPVVVVNSAKAFFERWEPIPADYELTTDDETFISEYKEEVAEVGFDADAAANLTAKKLVAKIKAFDPEAEATDKEAKKDLVEKLRLALDAHYKAIEIDEE